VPRAAAAPALQAAAKPPSCAVRIVRMPVHAASSACVASVEPSSTTRISVGIDASYAAASARRHAFV